MAVAVPRKHEAAVRGLERARVGRAAADARQGSARRAALRQAADDALAYVATADGLAAWCELAAGNIDMPALCLLEVMGQGGRGVLRTRPWISRNGAAIRKGERGYAVSMFGAYVWATRQTTGRFGAVGLVADGVAPTAVVDGYAEWCGDPIAGRIIAAMRGYRVAPFAETVSVERLEAALEHVRAIAWHLPACLSCDGAGCVLCSCLDDRSRRAATTTATNLKPSTVVVSIPVPSTRESQPRRGRPPKDRPAIPAVSAAAKRAAKLRAEADRVMTGAIRQAADDGLSFGDIAAAAGLSRQRVQQIVSGRPDRAK